MAATRNARQGILDEENAEGAIEVETRAIEHYDRIVEGCDGGDRVTRDMVIEVLHDEEGHRRRFEGFLREYQVEGLA